MQLKQPHKFFNKFTATHSSTCETNVSFNSGFILAIAVWDDTYCVRTPRLEECGQFTFYVQRLYQVQRLLSIT